MEDMQWSEFSLVLKPSSLGGVGVFATHDIPTGTILLTNSFGQRLLRIKDVPAAFMQYCVYLNDEECLCPERFDRLEIGWYINHSSTPNIARSPCEYSFEEINSFKARPFFAIQDIQSGDEILIDYTYLNEPEHLKDHFYKKTGWTGYSG
jgi:hypothetical protein